MGFQITSELTDIILKISDHGAINSATAKVLRTLTSLASVSNILFERVDGVLKILDASSLHIVMGRQLSEIGLHSLLKAFD